MRRNGMLLPISALPSEYGIGCFSKEAYEFIDLLKRTGQSLWQILPLGPTGYGDSPYQSFSTFAGNPYFIDLEQLVEHNLLTKEDCAVVDFGSSEEYIDYEKLYDGRFTILRKAFENAVHLGELKMPSYLRFCEEQKHWLADYALFMAVKQKFGDRSWDTWDEDIRSRMPEALKRYRHELRDEIQFWQYLQFLFNIQWQQLKSYANQNDILIIGDIPIYVAFDSADIWAHPELFQVDDKQHPTAVAGCPPDGFSETGQLWGNPLYEWEQHKKTGYAWWIRRMEYCMKLYDITRIDHFRGFDEYYAIPAGNKTAENGRWMSGPGMELFTAIQKKQGRAGIIAEDLGFLTDGVRKLLSDSGYPGMKVLQFAFDSREESDYLPHNYEADCIVYTGTHDNDTLRSWYLELAAADKELVLDYLNAQGCSDEKVHWDIISLAMSSVAADCIIPVQDFLYLGKETRINTPSTLGENWTWRMKKGMFSDELMKKIRRLTKIYGRI